MTLPAEPLSKWRLIWEEKLTGKDRLYIIKYNIYVK